MPSLRQLLKCSQLPGDLQTPQLMRFGRPADGGYIVPRDPEFPGESKPHPTICVPLISFGVGGDISFEIDWIRNCGFSAACYDPHIDSAQWGSLVSSCSPREQGCLHFFQKCGELTNGHPTAEAWELIHPESGWALKMDIEGGEYDILEAHLLRLSEARNGCRLIVMEIHWLDHSTWYLRAIPILQRLHEHWLLIHTHNNNCSLPWRDPDGFPQPGYVELTWWHRSLLPAGWVDTPCPHERPILGLDFPNV